MHLPLPWAQCDRRSKSPPGRRGGAARLAARRRRRSKLRAALGGAWPAGRRSELGGLGGALERGGGALALGDHLGHGIKIAGGGLQRGRERSKAEVRGGIGI